jgi:hypothetical protein
MLLINNTVNNFSPLFGKHDVCVNIFSSARGFVMCMFYFLTLGAGARSRALKKLSHCE